MRPGSRFLFSLLFLFLSLLAVATGIALRVDPAERAFAKQGILDLRGHNFDRQSRIDFGGEWAFYWQQHLAPEAFTTTSAPQPDAFLTLPGDWQDVVVDGQRLGGPGYATLRLTLLTDPAQAIQALRIGAIYSAYRLWINGQIVAESGRLGTSRAEETMEHSSRLAPLRLDGAPLELVLQVSSFHLAKTNLPILSLGQLSVLNAAQHRTWGLALFCAGTLLLMAVYHVTLFAFYRKNSAPLFFGLYCFVWSGFLVSNVTSDWAIRVFFPDLGGEFLYRSSLAYYALAAPLSYHVFRSLYPDEFPRLFLHIFWGLGSVFGAIALFAPTHLSSQWLPAFHLVVLARALIYLWGLTRATAHNRQGSGIVLTGFLILCLFSFNDILSSLNVLQTPHLMHLGMLFFMLTQALALARQFTRLFAQVERLSVDLTERNQALENEIAERSRLQQEIVSISENERRHLSHELHDGLCQQLTGARLQSAALELPTLDDATRKTAQARLSQLLTESVDHAYRLSRGLWSLGPESDDIGKALGALARTQTETSGIPISVTRHPACAECQAPHAPQIYGIAREALVNAIKHARPSKIELELDCREAGQTRLSITDNGIGITRTPGSTPGLGLRIMTYRAEMVGGKCRIDNTLERGTQVSCTIPCRAGTLPENTPV